MIAECEKCGELCILEDSAEEYVCRFCGHSQKAVAKKDRRSMILEELVKIFNEISGDEE